MLGYVFSWLFVVGFDVWWLCLFVGWLWLLILCLLLVPCFGLLFDCVDSGFVF